VKFRGRDFAVRKVTLRYFLLAQNSKQVIDLLDPKPPVNTFVEEAFHIHMSYSRNHIDQREFSAILMGRRQTGRGLGGT
jgi:hypothetical protein